MGEAWEAAHSKVGRQLRMWKARRRARWELEVSQGEGGSISCSGGTDETGGHGRHQQATQAPVPPGGGDQLPAREGDGRAGPKELFSSQISFHCCRMLLVIMRRRWTDYRRDCRSWSSKEWWRLSTLIRWTPPC